MEHVQTLLEGIDDVKHYLTDRDYIKLMNALTKLNDIVKEAIQDNDDYSDTYSDFSYLNFHRHNIEEEKIGYILDEYNDIYSNIENEFTEFMNKNNLPAEFLQSSFNIMEYVAYNQSNIGQCNCSGLEFCSDSITNFLKCKNIQKIILYNPLLCVIHYKLRNLDINLIFTQINTFHIFSFNPNIIINMEDNENTIVIFIRSCLNFMTSIYNRLDKVLVIISMFNYICKNGYYILYKFPHFRNTVYNKIATEMSTPDALFEINFLADKLHFNNNIFQTILHNMSILFPDIQQL